MEWLRIIKDHYPASKIQKLIEILIASTLLKEQFQLFSELTLWSMSSKQFILFILFFTSVEPFILFYYHEYTRGMIGISYYIISRSEE